MYLKSPISKLSSAMTKRQQLSVEEISTQLHLRRARQDQKPGLELNHLKTHLSSLLISYHTPQCLCFHRNDNVQTTQEEPNPHFIFSLNLPVWINLSVRIHRKQLASYFGELPPLFPNSAAAVGWFRERFGGKRQSSIARANPFQLNLNNQSARELRIQAGQKAKVLLLSLLQHHLPWDVTAFRRAPPPH